MKNYKCCIYVPKTVQAMYEVEYGEWKPSELYMWQLTTQEFQNLKNSGVLAFLNKYFGKTIDAFEEQEIFYQQLYYCKEELYEGLKNFDCEKEINKLKEMIEYAIEVRTLINFSF